MGSHTIFMRSLFPGKYIPTNGLWSEFTLKCKFDSIFMEKSPCLILSGQRLWCWCSCLPSAGATPMPYPRFGDFGRPIDNCWVIKAGEGDVEGKVLPAMVLVLLLMAFDYIPWQIPVCIPCTDWRFPYSVCRRYDVCSTAGQIFSVHIFHKTALFYD